MSATVGAEYIIANALLQLQESGRGSEVSFAKIREIGGNIQQSCNEKGIDVIVDCLGRDIVETVVEYSNYFEFTHYISEDKAPMIRLNRRIPLDALRQRFVNYLPSDVEDVLIAEVKKGLMLSV